MKKSSQILKSETNILLIIGLLATGLYFFLPKKKNEVPEASAEPDTVEANPIAPKPTALELNKDLVLFVGIKAINEVKTLQSLLNLPPNGIDGIFGNQTRNALISKKGVEKISLNQFNKTPNVVKPPYKIGDIVEAKNYGGVKTTKNQTKNGQYHNTGAYDDYYFYGEDIGRVIAFNASKTMAVLSVDEILSSPKIVWANAQEIQKA